MDVEGLRALYEERVEDWARPEVVAVLAEQRRRRNEETLDEIAEANDPRALRALVSAVKVEKAKRRSRGVA